mmetsp:Transcript_88359/g.286068  ORF Transcript_88359/g.286068 Transcript_88359/m.286068 type:complete len:310 (-) Transcript_88359:7-936(-)
MMSASSAAWDCALATFICVPRCRPSIFCRVARRRSAHSEEPASVRCDCEGGMRLASSAEGERAQPMSVPVCIAKPGRCFATTSRLRFLQTNFGSKLGFQISCKHGGATRACTYFLLAFSTRSSFAKDWLRRSLRCLPRSGLATSSSRRGGTSPSSAAPLSSSFMSLAGTGFSRHVERARTFSWQPVASSRVSAVVSIASCRGWMPCHVEGTTPPSSDRRQPLARKRMPSSSDFIRPVSSSRNCSTEARLSFPAGGCCCSPRTLTSRACSRSAPAPAPWAGASCRETSIGSLSPSEWGRFMHQGAGRARG